LPAASDPRGYCKVGIDLEQTRRRLTGLCITSEMGESGRETAVSWRIGGVLTLGFLPSDDSLVKAPLRFRIAIMVTAIKSAIAHMEWELRNVSAQAKIVMVG